MKDSSRKTHYMTPEWRGICTGKMKRGWTYTRDRHLVTCQTCLSLPNRREAVFQTKKKNK